jgi:aminoglycoside phosphotransferase (APT) family kinase protein
LTISVEELAAPLTTWLAERLGTHEVAVRSLGRPDAGQSNDTVLCEVSARGRPLHLVVRRQALGTTIFREPDVLREAHVLLGLAATGVPVPEVYWLEPDPSVLGASFFVMERVDGRVPLGKPSIHAVGWLPHLTTPERGRLWTNALEVLTTLHAVEWQATHEFLLDGEPANAQIQPHVEALVAWYRWSADGREFPITDAAIEYLQRGVAGVDCGARPVLLWGDPRVGNMIFAEDHRVAAALDFETAMIGPAARDVAHWLFFDEFQTEAVGIERLAGWPDRETTIARYEALSGCHLGSLEFFDVMESLFMATTLIRQADARVARGLAGPDTRMAHDNTVTQMLARTLGLPVPDLSPDYLAHRGAPTTTRPT